MYHYHKRTHEPIPNEQLCEFGCNQPANYKGTGGKYSCERVTHHCPAYLEEHSKRIAEHWNRPGNKKRRANAKETFMEHCCNQEHVIHKVIETKRKRYDTLTPDELKDYTHYARQARAGAQRWAKENGHKLGQQTYHVDHRLSVKDAYRAGLPLGVLNHPNNLQILSATKNIIKGCKSEITVEQLLASVNNLLEKKLNLFCEQV